MGGEEAEAGVAVFRRGSTRAGFSSLGVAAVARGGASGRPAAVIEARAAKPG